MTKPQLFIDLDGLLADFDSYYESCFGIRPNQDLYEPPNLWQNINKHGSFFRSLPIFPGALDFWQALKEFHHNPIILSGIPRSVPTASTQKRAWVNEHLGEWTQVICCRSVDKHIFGDPGDILVDDRLKYSKYWLRMGGVFVPHTSFAESLSRVKHLYSNW